MRLPIEVHKKVHWIDYQIDDKLVEKDAYYYLTIIRCAYKLTERIEL